MENLFDTVEDSGGKRKHTRSEVPLLFPTNLPNLIHFLSRGYLAPVECFSEKDKYYGDLLEIAPGRLPLLTPPVHESVVDLVQSESKNTARPVLVELNGIEFAGDLVSILDEEGNPARASLSSEDLAAAAPPAVIPTAEIECIHFLENEDLRQFKIRPFENIRGLPKSLTSVSPSLQASASLDVDTLRSWLSSLNESPVPSASEFTSVDRTAGAAALMAYLNPNLTEEVFSLLSGRNQKSELIPSWISLPSSDLPGETPISDGEEDSLPDKLTFLAASSILRLKTSDDLVPSEALKEISEEVAESEKLSEEDQAGLQESINRIDSVLANESPFEGVKSDKYPALQGLMFFLIKERPEPLLKWGPDDTGASMDAHIASAAYCGFVHGHAGLPLIFRSKRLDDRLAKWAAGRLTRFPASNVDAGESEEADRLDSQAEPSSSQLLSKFFSEDLEREGRLRATAIELCRRNGWTDCVETLVFAPDRSTVEAQVTKKGGPTRKLKMAWRIPGVAEIKYNLNVERFRSKIGESDISEEIIEEIFEQQEIRRAEEGH